MISKELVFQVMAERDLSVHDKRLVRLLTKRVGASLKHYKHKGVLRATKRPGAYFLWEILS